MTFTLFGAPLSLYTGKARSYLRRQAIDFDEESPGGERYLHEIMPTVGRFIIPCMLTPDGEVIQDGADIIDHFEKGPGRHLRRFDVYPDSPVLLAISHLFELFGGEGLLRPASTTAGTSTTRTWPSCARRSRSSGHRRSRLSSPRSTSRTRTDGCARPRATSGSHRSPRR